MISHANADIDGKEGMNDDVDQDVELRRQELADAESRPWFFG
jgi:hypothetical protein